MTVAHAIRSMHGSPHCGDAAQVWHTQDVTVLCIVDGLGHGPDAERAAQACTAYVAQRLLEPMQTLFAGCDRAIAHTRGVALGIARVDAREDSVEYGAVGNTRAMLVHPGHRRFLISSPGIIGGGYRRLHTERISLTQNQRLILYTDGFPRRLDAKTQTTGLLTQPLQLLANQLIETVGKVSDDNAVLIYRHDEQRPDATSQDI